MKPDELWSGIPNVLIDGVRFTIGWQHWPEGKGGPSFVTARRSALGTFKIVERYPLTDDGWARAWMALVKLDPAAAEKVLPVLAHRAEVDSGFAERKCQDSGVFPAPWPPPIHSIGGHFPRSGRSTDADAMATKGQHLPDAEKRLAIGR